MINIEEKNTRPQCVKTENISRSVMHNVAGWLVKRKSMKQSPP
jgi:hypothetical protein